MLVMTAEVYTKCGADTPVREKAASDTPFAHARSVVRRLFPLPLDFWLCRRPGQEGPGHTSLQILRGPGVDPFQRRIQILQRVGHAEAEIAFAECAKGCAGKARDSGLF